MRFPHGDKSLDELEPHDEVVLSCGEIAWYTAHVWGKPQEYRTPNDMRYIAWVNKKDGK